VPMLWNGIGYIGYSVKIWISNRIIWKNNKFKLFGIPIF
jgi:hypothetical protein